MEKIDKFFKETIENGVIEIVLHPETTIKKFDSLNSFLNFIETEIKFWQNFKRGNLAHNVDTFNHIKNLLNAALIAIDKDNIDGFTSNLQNALHKLKTNKIIYSQTSLATFLNELKDDKSIFEDAAFDYIMNNDLSVNSFREKKYFNGTLSGYFFHSLDKFFKQKAKSEKETFEEIRKKYSEAKDSLEIYYNNKTNEIENDAENFKSELTKWHEDKQIQVSIILDEYKKNFDELNKVYEEKIRVEGPATYWKELHTEYITKGRWWTASAIVVSSILVILLTCLLYNFPEQLKTVEGKFTITNFKATIVLALIISTFIYLIRLFVKLATSAYHLSRDAKERLQLTHIFLAMVKDKAIDEKERHIILQSLFSRADTGLLKGDHSPEMPDGISSSILKNIIGK